MKALWREWLLEYRRIAGDAGALLIFFGAILVYPIVYPLPYSQEVLRNVPIAVVDLDRSQLSRRLARMMDAHELLRVAAQPSHFEEAKDLFYRGKVNGIVVIPKDFSKNVARGVEATVPAYADASYFLLYRQVLTGVVHSVGTMSAGVEIRRAEARGASPPAAIKTREPLALLPVPLFAASGGYATYVAPPVLLLILQQTLLIGIGMMAGTVRPQERGVGRDVPALRSGSPVPAILGKAMAYLTIYMLHAVYITLILFRLYRFPQRGSAADLMLFLLPFLLSVIFLALSISTFFHERETAMVILLCTSIPAVFLSGFSWPVEAIPQWLRLLSHLIPSTAGIDGFLKINSMGASLREVAVQWCILWGLTFLYFIWIWFASTNSVQTPGAGHCDGEASEAHPSAPKQHGCQTL